MESYERKALNEQAVKLRAAMDKLDALFDRQYGDDESLKLHIDEYIEQKDEAKAYVLAFAKTLLITVEVYAMEPKDDEAA